ncbi:hypothetical protein [Geodermatophilus sp. DSM 44513]|uniref:hypothetical protein n=1 Tax=Geodermatophilus sp. DSM 44513 TaxID=1528104 RepID=UPI0012777B19|nr:hypothetical protein [Geodermatophilus sp. DSM 44513]WNV74085.1 hypothetical protein RTG05_13925 [Geodermatophilus sp. DSM 44513]
MTGTATDVVAEQTRTADETLREVEDLLRTVAGWLPVVVGHLVHHRDQLHDVLRSRGRLPGRFDRAAGQEG